MSGTEKTTSAVRAPWRLRVDVAVRRVADIAPLVALPVAVVLLTPAAWPKWAFMWLLAFAIYAGFKWLTWRKAVAGFAGVWATLTHVGPDSGESGYVKRHLGYLFAWPGMDADAFLDRAPLPAEQRPAPHEWTFALAKTALGLVLFFGVTRLVPEEWPVVAGWVGMAGIIFILHFGTFHLLSCGWRAAGVRAKPLMHWPVLSESVSEFWGRRWNTAFRDLTHRYLFRPLTRRFGPRWALLLGFLFSGIVHDLVITVPAGGGYGGPTAFFLIQAAALFAERSNLGKRIGLGRGWRGWLFTALVLVPTAPLLFPPVFVREIVVPFLRDLGAM